MKLKAILFDLDGTLLPMNQEKFVKAYFTSLTEKIRISGFNEEKNIKAIYTGIKAMVLNDGIKTNEVVFWDNYKQIIDENINNIENIFNDFYINDFKKLQNVCGFNKQSSEIIEYLYNQGITLILATNPLFPFVATKQRIEWAGINPEYFEYVTTFENSSFCKPNIKYYYEILNKLDLQVEECIMIGNDVKEDMIVKDIGMKCFLITNDLINKENLNIDNISKGTFDDFIQYIKNEISEN